MSTTMRVRKGDLVQILSGKDRGKQGKVLEARPTEGRVLVENLNVAKRHTKPRPMRDANRMGRNGWAWALLFLWQPVIVGIVYLFVRRILGTGRPDLERADWLHYHCESFPGATAPCAVVGRPADGELWRAADLPASGLSAERLAAAAAPLAAIFFLPPSRCGPGGCR